MRITFERPIAPPTPVAETPTATDEADFSGSLTDALGQLDDVTRAADKDAEGLVSGDVGLHESMISMEKANLMLRMGTTVRNKLLDAYRQLNQAGG